MADGPLLAQINLGTLVAPIDDPAITEFIDALDRVNAQAELAPGFVWRLQSDQGNATSIHTSDDPKRLVNMSVWTSVDALKDYVYRGEHVEFFRRRAEWFVADAKRVALWWIPAGTTPPLDDALHRIAFFERHGASPYAFGFARPELPLLFEETDLDDADTQGLVRRLNAELRAVAEDPSENHFNLATAEVTGSNGRMLRARYNGELVACGAVRRIDPTVGEVKRMFVAEDLRGRKLGAAVLDQLELHAHRLGITELKLETSAKQPAAVGLYERFGFERCEPWGEYLDTPRSSLCFRKVLEPPRAEAAR